MYPLPLSAGLEERLDAWRNAPGRGWEPADYVAWNLQTCGEVIPNHNKDLIAKASLIWAVMNSSTIISHREHMAQYLEAKKAAGAFDDPVHISQGGRGLVGDGRGLVFTAGNADTLRRVVWSLRLIRNHHNCTLPASIFHFPSEAPEPDDPIRETLTSLGATLVSATSRTKDSTRTKNYHLKAQAIVEAPYAEVLYLDSDNLPAASPDFFFTQKNYKRLGAMFWPDYWKTSANNPMWAILGVQCRDEWEQEAGQIVIDKRRHLDAMLLSAYMLEDWQFWYYFSDGDKDVFRFSFLALRKRWALPGRWVGAAGLPSGTPSGDFCAHTMQQYDNDGEPAFIPSGVGRGYSWGRTKQVQAMDWEYGGPGGAHDPPLLLEAISKKEFEEKGLSNTERFWEANSVAGRGRARYHQYPYPDAEPSTLGSDGVRGADDVEADMLANARDDGRAIQPAHVDVMRRAAVERGLRPFFHGGVISALCIDVKYVSTFHLLVHVTLYSLSFPPISFEDPYKTTHKGSPREANTVQLTEKSRKTAPNELGVDWGISPLEIAQWSEDDRLMDIEDWMYDDGFIPNAAGF
ncbi:hypothetical protein DL93DRAFT_2126696 [Clavulina sp. PMI_390]|nr:hypothetical protein DL93DRAFT_2126696 [Clavulina sp. PMI_390]